MMGESLRRKPEVTPGAVHRQGLRRLVVAALLTSSTSAMAQHATQTATRAGSSGSEEAPSTHPVQPDSAPLAASASGEAALDERAQRHWGSGMAYLDEDNYAKALEAFEKAYELSGRPRILLAIAVTHERRGDLGQAIATLDEYLRLAPTADNAESIHTHRGELQAQHDEQLQKMSDARKGERAVTGRVPPNVPAPEPVGAAEEATYDSEERNRSTWRWTAFGVGVASGVAATVSGLMAVKKYDELREQCDVGLCARQDTRTGRTMAWVSTALTGVAVVGLGVGVWLTLDEPDDARPTERKAARQVHVGLAYRPSGLTSEVSWSF